MLAIYKFIWEPAKIEDILGLKSDIDDICQSSDDYQNGGMECKTYFSATHDAAHTIFTFYLDRCDQKDRTRETMRKIQLLIEKYM